MLAITLALVAYGLISRKIEGSILTGPTLFTVFGLVAGPAALGLIPLQMGNEALHPARSVNGHRKLHRSWSEPLKVDTERAMD